MRGAVAYVHDETTKGMNEGKDVYTLMREINPFDASAKLGAETLLEIMKVTSDIRPLQFMATEMGCSLDNAHA